MTFDGIKFLDDFEFNGLGKALSELGLLSVKRPVCDYHVEPTDKLRAMFYGRVDLAHVYPLLCEMLVENSRQVEWKLKAAGMTDDGLEAFNEMLCSQT